MVTGSFGGKLGIIAEANVVPLIDILLVLLVIFMVIPHRQFGLDADLPRQVDSRVPYDPPAVIIVRVASDGTVWINRDAVNREELGGRLERLFAARHDRVAFLQGDRSLEFQLVAQVLESDAFCRSFSRRFVDFRTGKKTLNVVEWHLHSGREYELPTRITGNALFRDGRLDDLCIAFTGNLNRFNPICRPAFSSGGGVNSRWRPVRMRQAAGA